MMLKFSQPHATGCHTRAGRCAVQPRKLTLTKPLPLLRAAANGEPKQKLPDAPKPEPAAAVAPDLSSNSVAAEVTTVAPEPAPKTEASPVSTTTSTATATAPSTASTATTTAPITPAESTATPSPPPESTPASTSPQTAAVKSFPVELRDDDLFGTKGLVAELTDQKKFGKRGEAWFFAQALVLILICFPPMELKGLLDFVGTLAISAGFVFLAYALLCLGRSLSPLPAPRQGNQLVTTGMYGYVRHPMYGGLLMVALGMALVTGSESRLALGLLLWWILEQKANVEEFLLEQMHPEYAAYKQRVKKFIPYIY